ncbi:MAG: pirin family protein, partial [Candidatus Nucleicultricaceae bacterium]
LIACESEGDEVLFVNQNINIYLGCFDGQESTQHPIRDQRRSWLYVVKGSIFLNGFILETGDSAEIDKEQMIILNQGRESEVMLFDFLHPALK